MKLFGLLFGAILVLSAVECAKILVIFHMPAFSHQQLGVKLIKGLAEKGHEVTYMTPLEPKDKIKNLKIIKLKSEPTLSNGDEQQPNFFEMSDMSIFFKMFMYDYFGLTFTQEVLDEQTVLDFLKSNEKFDAVIMENFLNEAFRGFCFHFKAPCILLSTIGATRWSNLQMGNPASPSYVPDLYVDYSSYMNFWERFVNSFVYVATEMYRRVYVLPKHNQILHKAFPDAPDVSELYFNSSLMLLNSDVSTNAPVPYVANMVNIGGFHVSAPKKLPEDLQKILDESPEGVIYFSMGSNLKSKDMSKEKLESILKVFGKLKQKVLWKFEDESLPGRPSNLVIRKWLPQQDVLAHPNIKLFITHGGLLSTIEAIYHGIPIIGIPIFGDQEINVANAVMSGYAHGLTYKSLNEETLQKAINEVLNNPKYSNEAKKRSGIMHDQPMKPIDRAVFWIEYVMRHQGAPHLKTAALSLAWYQYLLLDVVAFVAVIGFTCMYLVCKTFKLLFGKKDLKSSKVGGKKKMN